MAMVVGWRCCCTFWLAPWLRDLLLGLRPYGREGRGFMPRPPRGCGVLYLLTLLGELEVYLLCGEAVCVPYREDIAAPRRRRLVVVDELVAGRVVAQRRATGGVLFEHIAVQKVETAAGNRLLSTAHGANQELGRTVADQGAGAIPELPLYGVGPAVLASIDRVPVDRLQEAVEGRLDAVRGAP